MRIIVLISFWIQAPIQSTFEPDPVVDIRLQAMNKTEKSYYIYMELKFLMGGEGHTLMNK